MSSAKKSRRSKKKSSRTTKLASGQSSPLTAIQRLLGFINDKHVISSIYWGETIGLSKLDIPSLPQTYPKLDVLWLGCEKPREKGNHYHQYYLVEIANPDPMGGPCPVDLFDLGVQNVIEDRTPTNLKIKRSKKGLFVSVKKFSDGKDIKIGPGRNLDDLDSLKGSVKIYGTKYDLTLPQNADKVIAPYSLLFSGPRCVLRVDVPDEVGPRPNGDQGSPPPPFTGGRPLVPR